MHTLPDNTEHLRAIHTTLAGLYAIDEALQASEVTTIEVEMELDDHIKTLDLLIGGLLCSVYSSQTLVVIDDHTIITPKPIIARYEGVYTRHDRPGIALAFNNVYRASHLIIPHLLTTVLVPVDPEDN